MKKLHFNNLAAGRERDRRRHSAHAASVLGVAVLLTAAPVHAAFYRFDDVSVAFDTTITAGATMRVQDADEDSVSLGNQNFDEAGDVTSTLARGTHEIDVRKGNFGFFGSTTYLFDPVIYNDDDIPDEAQDEAGKNIKLLDAFGYWRGDVAGIETYGRLGNQVINWGESTFFPGGINTLNPVDVPASRTPGADLREILFPVPAALLGANLTQNLSLEAFAQLKWEPFELDPVGTFFSTSDVFGDGGGELVLGPGLAIPNAGRKDADDTGAFGITGSYTMPDLGYSEIGVYYLNYHSALPFLGLSPATTPGDASTAAAFRIYPEDIDLYGISFNTALGNWSLQGEYSYRDNLPIGLNAADFIPVFLGGDTAETFDRFGYSQFQMTGTNILPPNTVPTVDQMSVIIEGGYNRVHDHPSAAELAGVTDDAYGARMLLVPQWFDVFNIPGIGNFNMEGEIDYGYSIEGVSPASGPGFSEGDHQLGLSFGLKFQDRFSATLNYIGQFGNDDADDERFNPSHDRDFIQLSTKYSF